MFGLSKALYLAFEEDLNIMGCYFTLPRNKRWPKEEVEISNSSTNV